jgi:hypothetical protein
LWRSQDKPTGDSGHYLESPILTERDAGLWCPLNESRSSGEGLAGQVIDLSLRRLHNSSNVHSDCQRTSAAEVFVGESIRDMREPSHTRDVGPTMIVGTPLPARSSKELKSGTAGRRVFPLSVANAVGENLCQF